MNDRDLARIEKVYLQGDAEPFHVGTRQYEDGTSRHEEYRSTFEVEDFLGQPGFRFTVFGGRSEVAGPLSAIAGVILGELDEDGQWK